MSVRSRKTLLTAVTLTAGLSLAAVTPALAGAGANRTARAGAVSTAQGDPRDVTQHVADFYAAYIDSARATDDPSAATGAKALRGFYLSSSARAKVAAYEKRQHADGVLFAQNVPVKWKVAHTGSGAGHATSRVTLTWSDGPHARVTGIDVLSDLKTLKITDLKPVR
ncbi:hypothetical protein SAMN05428944_1032 [Streptomyces sp. 1222.5]|uniref:hypothetical protein n=1 Tax=unclassified Streptomyces TaxID=2593676 RepID=UPI00089AD10C|nr:MULTISPECIES: hypothetical protein [unclassified Streptomyces]PKW11744.1 hypothetical protein BX260_7063 [Streptomyces sp. 5112.2]SEB71097.1 hypothetical protein SAMN05428944_1032 [Streptomyces sp. 1222.5]SEE19641.1 hypothetical protein SAMN05216532_7291 [Streptomyces sp. 2231.1]